MLYSECLTMKILIYEKAIETIPKIIANFITFGTTSTGASAFYWFSMASVLVQNLSTGKHLNKKLCRRLAVLK